MFTGLIEDVGKIGRVQRQSDDYRLTVQLGGLPGDDIRTGDSIAVNGVCLTVVSLQSGQFCADVSPETLQKTTLVRLKAGSSVNLERALTLSSRLGGHLVYGHVDEVAVLTSRSLEQNCIRMGFKLSRGTCRYLVAKGSVAIDGISLTVNTVGEEDFTIAVIPHTLEKTTLKDRKIGDPVNIEVDIFAKYIERLLNLPAEGGDKNKVDSQFLAKHGFL
ncbi:MAG: riboflavin synthase [Deltaproteobacteria bacterium]|nr:riboflavin synthase [Deltaproteobacteria bacterium]